MTDPKSVARWVLRGEENVVPTLDSLTADLSEVQRRVDELSRRSAEGDAAAGGRLAEIVARIEAIEQRLGRLDGGPISKTDADAWVVPEAQSGDGVNVVGYLQRQLGLGYTARRLDSLLRDHGIATSPVSFGAAPSPIIPTPYPATQRLDHRSTIAVVAADQLDVLHRHHPEVFEHSERMIAYCFWELEEPTDEMVRNIELVDEVWVGSTFIEDALSGPSPRPVRQVRIPIAEPVPSDRPRTSFAPLAGADGHVVFGVIFDHFSAMERKNPLGVIEAYRRAFGPGDGRMLVVKTLNGRAVPDAHHRLLEAAAGRDDIVVWDVHLGGPDHFAFMSHLDVLVSLHRSEGLGNHLAEAMWLGVPVIASRYSGNLDFMDDGCSRLVDVDFTTVGDEARHYPAGFRWADPDLDDAAAAMRELAEDPDRRAALAAAGRERMLAEPDDATTARTFADLLGIPLRPTT